jgi:hypothetical protein
VKSSRLEWIYEQILRAFHSMDNPDFRFVERTYRRGVYDELLTDLAQRSFSVENVTDLNNDHCYVLSLMHYEGRWTLWLSLIGPYAVVVRVAGNNYPVVDPISPENHGEARLIEAVGGTLQSWTTEWC